uniref:Teneurin-like YD-shell domain-containing protein n=1 Tax=Eptatretus burgeri TaxID=7764 RepID=A0A8C4PZW0_EPTBU
MLHLHTWQVHDRNLLSLDYDRDQHVQKVYDDHRRFLLRIQHDEAGRPSAWLPGDRLTSLNLSYAPGGLVAVLQHGSIAERRRYDARGRLTSRSFPDGSTWTYSYMEQAVVLLLPSQRQYVFGFDATEHLSSVTMPDGARHILSTRRSPSYYRNEHRGPGSASPMLRDYSYNGRLLQATYLGTGRRVLYRYGARGHLSEVLFDGTRASFTYDERSGLLHAVTVTPSRPIERPIQGMGKSPNEIVPENMCSLRFRYMGPLLERQVSRCGGLGGAAARFEYTYDGRLRVTGLQAVVNEQPLPIDLFRYDDVTGRLEQFGKFGVIYYDIDPVVTTSSMTLTKRRDNLGRITEVQYEISRSLLFWLTVRYDPAGRVAQRHLRVGPVANGTALEYEYDPDGQLQAVAVDGRPAWRYSYDLNGNLHLLSPGASSHLVPLRYAPGDRLTRLGDLTYDLDADGFLHGRGNDRFEYDSRGLLVQSWGGGGSTEAWSITYGYDAFGRRAWRKDQRGGFLQFFYADMSRPTRLTHVYNHTNREITAYYYDLQPP